MMRSVVFNMLLMVSLANAFSVNRRDVMKTLVGGAVVAVVPAVTPALESCPPKSNNCVRTTWTPPSKDVAVADLKAVIDAYPQEGQNKVDLGGWSIASDNLESDGTARIEYLSDPKGNFARFLNRGKSFVDDLLIEVGADGVTEIKSSSRVGDSDLGVNAKVSTHTHTQIDRHRYTERQREAIREEAMKHEPPPVPNTCWEMIHSQLFPLLFVLTCYQKRVQYLGAALKEKGWSVPAL